MLQILHRKSDESFKKECLKKIFSSYGSRFIDDLLPHLRRLLYFNKSYVIRRGEHLEFAVFVKNGSLSVLNVDENTISSMIRPGELFGDVALFCPNTRAEMTVVADGTTEVFVLYQKDLEMIVQKHPQERRFLKERTMLCMDNVLTQKISSDT